MTDTQQSTTGQLMAQGTFLPENLRRDDYTNTLTVEAARVGFYTAEDVLAVQKGLMDTLAVVIGYASKNESTSVRIDKANGYLGCILYNCDTYLLTLQDPQKAAEELRSLPVEELYNRGFAINRDHFQRAKRLFANVRYTRLHDGSKTYNRAIDILLPHYLAAYDPRFNSQDQLYMSIPSLHIRGPFHIDAAADMLERLLEKQKGQQSDVEL